jgi:mono/diheme cytochrome c family protein
MLTRSIALSSALVLLSATPAIQAADAEAGKAKVQQVCSECHEVADFKGKSEAELKSRISDIVAGKIKHKKKLQLTDDEVANIAAYLAGAAAK